MKRVLCAFCFLIFANSMVCAPNSSQPKNSFFIPALIGIMGSISLFLLYQCFWPSHKKSGDNYTSYFSYSNTPIIQGSGIKKEKRIVLNAPINEIMMRCAGGMGIFLGETDIVTISADDNIIDLLEARQESKRLDCKYTRDNVNILPKVPISFLVQITKQSLLKLIETQSTGSVCVNGGVEFDKRNIALRTGGSGSVTNGAALRGESDVVLESTGTGDIVINQPITCKNLKVALGGSGKLTANTITGHSCTRAQIKTTGTGNVHISELTVGEDTDICGTSSGSFCIENLSTTNAKVRLSGTGNFKSDDMQVKDKLYAESTSSGGFAIKKGYARTAEIRLDGTGNFNAPSFHVGAGNLEDNFYANLSSTGSLHMGNIKAQDFTTKLYGTGSFQAQTILTKALSIISSNTGEMACDKVISENARVHLSGTGSVSVTEFNVLKKLIASATSVGSLNFTRGSVEDLELTLSGTGFFKADDLVVNNSCNVRASSVGGVLCTANGSISGSLTGIGMFQNKGKPRSNTLQANKRYKQL